MTVKSLRPVIILWYNLFINLYWSKIKHSLKQTLTKILILAFVVNLLLPSGSVRAFSVYDSNTPAAKPQILNDSYSVQVVKVVALNYPATVSINQLSTTNSVACTGLLPGNTNLIQNAGELNLNEPADCFNLSLAAPIKITTVNLAVEPLQKNTEKVSVIGSKTQISSPQFGTGSIPQQIPVLPIAIFIVAMSGFVSIRRLVKNNLNLINFRKQALTLHQLQMLRC
jgi:hypothetical protein